MCIASDRSRIAKLGPIQHHVTKLPSQKTNHPTHRLSLTVNNPGEQRTKAVRNGKIATALAADGVEWTSAEPVDSELSKSTSIVHQDASQSGCGFILPRSGSLITERCDGFITNTSNRDDVQCDRSENSCCIPQRASSNSNLKLNTSIALTDGGYRTPLQTEYDVDWAPLTPQLFRKCLDIIVPESLFIPTL